MLEPNGVQNVHTAIVKGQEQLLSLFLSHTNKLFICSGMTSIFCSLMIKNIHGYTEGTKSTNDIN